MTEKTIGESATTFDPSVCTTTIGFLQSLFSIMFSKKDWCVPAIVDDYDCISHEAVITPIVQRIYPMTTGEMYSNRPTVTVPVLQCRHGGFVFDFPVKKGDTGWLISGDRAWSFAKHANKNRNTDLNKGPIPPDSRSLGGFEHGFFLPASWASEVVDGFVDPKVIPEEIKRKLFDRILIGNTKDEENKRAYLTIGGEGGVELHSGSATVILGVDSVSISNNLSVIGKRRKAIIDPDTGLADTDARFREITALVSAEKVGGDKVVIKAKRMRVLVDEAEDLPPFEFTIDGGGEGGGGSGGVTTQAITVVTDVEFTSDHKLVKKTATVNVVTPVSESVTSEVFHTVVYP